MCVVCSKFVQQQLQLSTPARKIHLPPFFAFLILFHYLCCWASERIINSRWVFDYSRSSSKYIIHHKTFSSKKFLVICEFWVDCVNDTTHTNYARKPDHQVKINLAIVSQIKTWWWRPAVKRVLEGWFRLGRSSSRVKLVQLLSHHNLVERCRQSWRQRRDLRMAAHRWRCLLHHGNQALCLPARPHPSPAVNNRQEA